MAKDAGRKLIKEAETLNPEEQLGMAVHLPQMVRQGEPAEIAHYRWSKIQAHRQEILEIAAKYGVFDVRVAGHLVQGKTPPSPEVEFIVNLKPGRSLCELGGLLMELRTLLGFEVYVVFEGGLKEECRERVLKEAIPLLKTP
ncbi:MAG: hypothetical protein AB1589_11975 [Cyanobacteriota bacterium]